MGVNFPHGTTITVRSVTTTDDGLGNTSETVVESSWGPCAVAPRYATESTDPRVPPVIVGVEVMGPKRAIDSDDVLVIPAEHFYAGEWQLDGLPANYDHPMTGWEPGMVVNAKRAGAV